MLSQDSLWYKDAIIYQLHVKAFYDSNGNGYGDFNGLIQKLDYIADLGVNTMWLLPFYPSPLRDDGYDIADYHNVHPDYGTMRDFRLFVREAHRRGLRVITELVINHTSDQHPWFQAARRAPRNSPKREYYVWSDTDKKFPETRIIFTDTETSNWAWDPLAQQYYWHRFFSHQPDLNHNNPKVVKAVTKVMRYWFDSGVDGMRLDAIPYLCVREGTNNENLPETHAVLKQMRAELDRHYTDRMFLAEANQWPEDVRDYFGNGDECHMAYHFPLMPRIYMSIAQEDRHPITDILKQTPAIPGNCQWAIFLRNHDELTLEMVTDRERDYMYQTYATEARMRVNVGIRRRLAPLMENNRQKIEMINSLLLSMPGSPIIYYGDEIGMGDNIYLGDRNGVRTPMQWSPDRNAGFSRADPARLYLPPIMDPVYGYQSVNVEAQSSSPSSLLNWMKRIIAVRKAHQAFGRGELVFIRPGNRKILAYTREYQDEIILCIVNLARSAQPVELDLSRFKGRVPVELMGRTAFPPITHLPYVLTLPGHSFYWFQLEAEAEAPRWHEPTQAPHELPVLVLSIGTRNIPTTAAERIAMDLLLEGSARAQLESEALPALLNTQRWFAAKGAVVQKINLQRAIVWNEGENSWLLCWIEVILQGSLPQVYFAPMALAWDSNDIDRIQSLLPSAIARVRLKARTGLLFDALSDEAFCRAMIGAMGEQRELTSGNAKLRFSSTLAYRDLASNEQGAIRRLGFDQSNTSVVVDERLLLKAYRRLMPGINPELEMSRYLTEKSPYAHIAPLAGTLEYDDQDTHLALAVLQGYVNNQGDGWTYTLNYLERFFEQCLLPGSTESLPQGTHANFFQQMRLLGERTAQLHQALSAPTDDMNFGPEPVSSNEIETWLARVADDVNLTIQLVKNRLADLNELNRNLAQSFIDTASIINERVGNINKTVNASIKTRYHGDFHLGQILIAHNDFVIVDFEGEPARPLAERRAKHSPLRDVAGMLRSISYAGTYSLLHITKERPNDRALLEPCARDWEKRSSEAFLNGYSETLFEHQPTLLPDWVQAQQLLALFLIEKALYETRYEINSRPDWLQIPLTGILRLVNAMS